MARRKTITRDQILTAAHQVISEKGFSHFTARNIATQMNCSTQPIYLEFKNMNDLKEELFNVMADQFSDDFLKESEMKDPFTELGLRFILFAKKNQQLYQSLYIEDVEGAQKMQAAFKKVFFTLLEKAGEANNETKESFFLAYFIYVSGLAAMENEKILSFEMEDLRTMLTTFLQSVREGKNAGATLFTLGNFA